MDLPIRSWGHFPSGNPGRATEAFLRGEKAFRGTDPMKGSPVRKAGEIEFFSTPDFPEDHGRQDRSIKSGEGAAQLVILDRFEDIGGVQGKKQAHRGGPVRGDGPKQEGQIKPRPRPRFSGQILDGHQGGQRRWHGRGGHGGKEPP